MLKEVKLLKHDTCYTYMLKRTGLYNLETSMMESNQFILQRCVKQKEQIQYLKPGDILLIEDEDLESVTCRRNSRITEKGLVYQESITWGLHFMVYEGNFDNVPTISDCIWITDNNQEILSIRLRDLRDITKSWVKLYIIDATT